MLKVVVGYPDPAEEAQIVARSLRAGLPPREVLDAEGLAALQRRVDDVYVDPRIISYAVGLVEATRKLSYWGAPELEGYVAYGASPRGSINLVHGARALAVLRGRRYVLPSDIAELAPDVLRHRLVLSYAALTDGITPDSVVTRVLGLVPAPQLDLAAQPTASA
jgi:MoxR-like ATPase